MKIGFVGLGHMGNPMCHNLLKRGHTLKVYDVVPELIQELAGEGCEAAGSAVSSSGRRWRTCSDSATGAP